ncbi:MAG: DUF3791 domain-containing protein [Prevotellaceae bacterium]|jgi:hypothetical protein|nr:DUF3791 domain-containing protein [Prevotellaceae bacterium]
MKKERQINKFVIFCLENFKTASNLSGKEALAEFLKYGVIQYLIDGYEVLHTQGRNYIVADIQDFINQRTRK